MRTTIDRKDIVAFTTSAKCGCTFSRVYRKPSPTVFQPIGTGDITFCERHLGKSAEARQCVKEVMYEVSFAALEQEREFQIMWNGVMKPKPTSVAKVPEVKPQLVGVHFAATGNRTGVGMKSVFKKFL
jgi:hypothetical protein